VIPLTEPGPHWRVAESGREAHLVENGAARCGEYGTGWRAVAGMPLCPVCAQEILKETPPALATTMCCGRVGQAIAAGC
jgi:hypothetical protein